MIVLDTHVALWIMIDPNSLGRRTRKMVSSALAEHQATISAVSFWELSLLLAKGRLRSVQSVVRLRDDLLQIGLIEVPLSGEIAILAAELENLHGDPADRFIAATAIAADATLMTADERLLRWRHPLRRQNAEL